MDPPRSLRRVFAAALFHGVAVSPFGQQADDRVLAGPELRGAGSLNPGQIAGRVDTGHLHAEADPEIGHVALAGEAGRGDLAFGTAFAETAGHQNAVDVLKRVDRSLLLEDLRIQPVAP